MPSVVFHNSITVDAPPDAVWDRLQQPDIWRSVGPVQDLWDPTVEDGVLIGFQWSTNIGGVVYHGTGTAVNPERPHHYELILDTSEMAGTISVQLAPGNPGGTEVEVALQLRSKGLLSSMFFPVVSRAVGNGFPAQIEDLAVRLGT